jgi:phosphotriesterase-related protein
MSDPIGARGGAVRTVLGDVPAASLGRTDYHEHLFQVSPLLVGDELDDESASDDEAERLRASGFDAMVDATPVGLGRRPEALARVSARPGRPRIVATTGAHRDPHYGSGHPLLDATERDLTALFTRDVVDGMPTSDDPGAPAGQAPDGAAIRAGVVKAGIDYWRISPFERRVLAAVAATSVATGAPVMVHLEHGSAATEVLDVLEAGGVPADAVTLAHADRNPDPVLHAELAARGAYLGYDGWARHRDRPDSDLIACFVAAAALGAGDRLLLGGDVARASRYVGYGGMPGLAYLGERVLPRLMREAGPEAVDAATVANPARWLGRFEVAGADQRNREP